MALFHIVSKCARGWSRNAINTVLSLHVVASTATRLFPTRTRIAYNGLLRRISQSRQRKFFLLTCSRGKTIYFEERANVFGRIFFKVHQETIQIEVLIAASIVRRIGNNNAPTKTIIMMMMIIIITTTITVNNKNNKMDSNVTSKICTSLSSFACDRERDDYSLANICIILYILCIYYSIKDNS